jgi:cytochrome c oxidase subunit III
MASSVTHPGDVSEWKLPDRGVAGILSLIVTETSLFTIFVVAYLYYIGRSINGPYPKDILRYPIWATICLLSSSATIVMAEHALKHVNLRNFKIWWGITILLGAEFLRQTGMEWHEFIYDKHFTISTNVFGTTFYSLVGLHASHVIVGMTFLVIVFVLTMMGFPMHTQLRRVLFLSWYWHFVDVVWVVVFTVVYIVGK